MISDAMSRRINETLKRDYVSAKWDVLELKKRLRDFTDSQIAAMISQKKITDLPTLIYELQRSTVDETVQAHLNGCESAQELENWIEAVRARLKKIGA